VTHDDEGGGDGSPEGLPTGGTGVTAEVRLAETSGRWVLAAAVLGSSVVFLTSTIVNVALPAMGEDLGAGIADRQWVVTGYLLSLSALLLLGGSLGDRFGRRRVFVIGVVWFGLASLACAVAPTLPALVAFRVLQGVGGAMLTPGSLAILRATFVPEDRARAIGAWSALISIATAIGPLAGGVLVDTLGWRWIFVLPLPLVVLVVYAAVRHVPETRSPAEGRVDLAGLVLSVVGLAGVTFAIIEAPERGLGPLVLLAGVAGALALVAFVPAERRSKAPMLPLEVFASRQFTAANVLTFVVYAALGGSSFLLIQHLQIVLGYSGTAAGAAFLPVSALLLVLSERSGALAQRIGPRWPLTGGSLLLAAGLAMMAGIDDGTGFVTGVLPAVVVFGLGLVGIVAPVTATALAAVEDGFAGVASGVNNAVSRVAQLLAVAALPVAAGLGASPTDIPPEQFAAGFSRAMLMAAALGVAGALIAWRMIRDDVLAVDG
jgi:EmrB/QacA subfamily drug resistance transporter